MAKFHIFGSVTAKGHNILFLNGSLRAAPALLITGFLCQRYMHLTVTIALLLCHLSCRPLLLFKFFFPAFWLAQKFCFPRFPGNFFFFAPINWIKQMRELFAHFGKGAYTNKFSRRVPLTSALPGLTSSIIKSSFGMIFSFDKKRISCEQ